jgi:hypothetical protein
MRPILLKHLVLHSNGKLETLAYLQVLQYNELPLKNIGSGSDVPGSRVFGGKTHVK